MENLYLMVGLGNPGREYARTRHNAGFMVLERVAARWKADWVSERKFHVRLAKAERGDRRALLCLPQTFMNASGEAVGALAGFYKPAMDRLLIVVDDADLPLGELRLRSRGGTGGHHGLESIQQHLGTTAFARLRVGIGRSDPAQREIAGHVLAPFAAGEMELLEHVLDRAADQVECWFRHGSARAMNEFNGVITIER